MYQCKTPALKSSKHGKLIIKARDFVQKWTAQSAGSRPYVRVKFLERGKQRVFVDLFENHLKGKSKREKTRRYPLLPCVRELLRNSTDCPIVTKDGNLMLEGATADGETFKVIIKDSEKGLYLWSFYPG